MKLYKVKNGWYAREIAMEIEEILRLKNLTSRSSSFLYKQVKNEHSDLEYCNFLQEVANTKDLGVYGRYFFDTLDVEPFEFSKFVANTHDANFCELFYRLSGANKEILLKEIVKSLNAKACFNLLVDFDVSLNEKEKSQLKDSIIDSNDVNVLKECLIRGDIFNDEEREIAEFSFKSQATPRKIKNYEMDKNFVKQEDLENFK